MQISVITPTCHRNDLLAKCLDRLAPGTQRGVEVWLPEVSDGSASPCYEVIITDDGAKSTAEEMVRKEYPWARWISGPRRGPAANRNNGAKHARGEWLVFLDDDCLPDASWIASLANAIRGEGLDVVEGKIVCPGKQDDPFEEHVENLQGGNYWSANLAVRRTAFEETTGFEEAFLEAGGEDMEFAWKIKKANLRARFIPEFLVLHPPRKMTWRKIWHRVFMIRWICLYRLATGQALPLGTNRLQISFDLISRHTLDLLRTTFHLFTKFDRSTWRRTLFFQVLKWVTFPLVIPHLLRWEFRFRDQLLERNKS